MERAHERSLVVHAYTFRNEVQRATTIPQASSHAGMLPTAHSVLP